MLNLFLLKKEMLVINTEKITDPNFIRTIAKLVSKWTGRIWQINNSTTSNIGKHFMKKI